MLKVEMYSQELVMEKTKKKWDVWLLYENFSGDLATSVEARNRRGQYFRESDILKMMKDTVSLMATLQHYSYKHKPIHPKNFYQTQTDEFKFDALDLGVYNFLSSESMTMPDKFKAPEELKGKHNLSKADSFSLGLVLLYAATLTPVDKANTDQSVLDELIKDASSRYSNLIMEVFRMLLEYDVETRPAIDSVYRFIRENESSLKSEGQQGVKQTARISRISTIDTASPRKGSLDLPKSKNSSLSASKSDSMSPNRRGSLGGAGEKVSTKAVSKFKTNGDTIENETQLQIGYEKVRPKYKLFHTFEHGTKQLTIIPLLNLKGLFMELVKLSIDFYIPKYHTSIYAEDQKFYLIGGEPEPKAYNCYCFELENDKPLPMPEMREKVRLNPGVVNIGDDIFVMGGSVNNVDKAELNSCEIYNIKLKQWRKMCAMESNIVGASYVTFNKRYIYRIGGLSFEGMVLGDIDKYDVERDIWKPVKYFSRTSDVFIPRLPHVIQVNESDIFVFGGYNELDEIMQQTFVIDCSEHDVDKEMGKMINAYNPKIFQFDHTETGECMVVHNEIVFLYSGDGYRIVSSFDGHTWRELKKFTM